MSSLKYKSLYSKMKSTVCGLLQQLQNISWLLFHQLYRTVNTCCITQVIQYAYFNTLSFIFGDRYKIEWKTHWQSPVCRAILRRKYYLNRSKSSLTWAICSFFTASLIFIDMRSEYFVSYFGKYLEFAWYTESAAFCIILFNGLSALALYSWAVFSKPMTISPIQRRLFHIPENEHGFDAKQNDDSTSEKKSELLHFSSFRESLNHSSPSILSGTPINYSLNSWLSASPCSMSLDTTSSSFTFYRVSPPLGYSTPKSPTNNKTSLRKLDYSPDTNSYDYPIKNKKQLDEFLKIQDDEKQMSVSSDEQKHFLSNMSTVENSPMFALAKCLYQRAYRTTNAESTEENSSDIHCGENILTKLKITDRMLTVYCERIRKWICQTILIKLVQEIEEINASLIEMGLPELQIGNVSLLALNQLAMTKGQNLPTLSAVLPYLDIHLNQDYLVSRMKTLARGGCMGNFKWNSGGTYKDKQWCDDLPTDSTLVMHILCCYFDAHLPSEPHFPEGKPFSSKYFKKAPEKPVVTKDSFFIYQSSTNPPHFKVVVPEDIYSLQKGRNNLFCTLVVFLNYIKNRECGMLGRVNLGRSGLNILWVLD